MGKIEIVSYPARYFELLTDDEITVTDANLINDELIEVNYENVDEFVEADGKTNVVIAAFTTTHARLKLYSVLEQLDHRVLYFDTDSVIYVTRDGQWEPPTESYLGDLTDELDGSYITTFASGGPKNYTCRPSQEKTICKVRGKTLNHRTKQKIDFNVICNMVEASEPNNLLYVDISVKIVRNRISKDILTKSEKKKYRIVYNKRIIVNNYDTLPYGF